MDDNKYIGTKSLQELINIIKNELAKKSDIVQFYTMPEPAGYTGRMVQYVGTPGPEDTFQFGHFYFSILNTWQEIAVQDEDPEKDIICHYKGRTTLDSLPRADRSNYSDIYRITDASVYGPPNTHVICSTVQGDGSIYEWRSLCGDIDYFRGLHDPDWSKMVFEFDVTSTGRELRYCSGRGIMILRYNDNVDIGIWDSQSNKKGPIVYQEAMSGTIIIPVNKDNIIVLDPRSASTEYRCSATFVPYKVQ